MFSVKKATLESQMSVSPSVSLTSKPLCLSESLLSAIEPIDHLAYRPLSLSTIEPIDHRAYRPSSLSSLSTFKPIDHQAYQPSSLSTIEPIDHQAYRPTSLLTKEANRGRVTPSTEFTCYHVAYLIGLSHLCALLV